MSHQGWCREVSADGGQIDGAQDLHQGGVKNPELLGGILRSEGSIDLMEAEKGAERGCCPYVSVEPPGGTFKSDETD